MWAERVSERATQIRRFLLPFLAIFGNATIGQFRVERAKCRKHSISENRDIEFHILLEQATRALREIICSQYPNATLPSPTSVRSQHLLSCPPRREASTEWGSRTSLSSLRSIYDRSGTLDNETVIKMSANQTYSSHSLSFAQPIACYKGQQEHVGRTSWLFHIGTT